VACERLPLASWSTYQDKIYPVDGFALLSIALFLVR
jgi:hypothetical protein